MVWIALGIGIVLGALAGAIWADYVAGAIHKLVDWFTPGD